MRQSNCGGWVGIASCAKACVAVVHRARDVARHLALLRTRLVDFALIVIAFVAASVAASAGTSGSVRAWYYDSNMGYGAGGLVVDQLPGVPYGMPTDLGMCRQVAVGGGHFAAVTRNDTLRLWGNNDHGQLNLPEDFGPVSRVSLGEYHTVALATDGYVAAWGNNWFGQTNVPYNLGQCNDVAAGGWHCLAIRSNGTVRGWGANDYGQRSIPASLSSVSSLAAGRYHSVALRSDGSVRAWGDAAAGVNEANGRTGIARIVAGPRTTMLLRAADGGVEEYGSTACMGLPVPSVWNGSSQVTGKFSAIAAATNVRCGSWDVPGSFGLAGRARSPWGSCEDDPFGGWRVPSFNRKCLVLAGSTVGGESGTDCFLAIVNDDCNDNGFADADDIASGRSPDLNGNGIPDSCDVSVGTEEDCDSNGVIDSVQQQLNVAFNVQSGQVGPIGYTSPRSVDLAAPPYTLGDVTLQVTAFGDFSSVAEYLKIYLNGRWVAETLGDSWGKNDCQSPVQRLILIPRDFFNEAIQNGPSTSATFDIVPSIAVSANQCPSGSWVQLSLTYSAAITGDCNANGLLDTCEVAQFPEFDTNSNGLIDACENYTLVFQCEGDLDGDGSVNMADASLLLLSFGRAMPGDPNDLDHSGLIDIADISMLLLSFGDC